MPILPKRRKKEERRKPINITLFPLENLEPGPNVIFLEENWYCRIQRDSGRVSIIVLKRIDTNVCGRIITVLL